MSVGNDANRSEFFTARKARSPSAAWAAPSVRLISARLPSFWIVNSTVASPPTFSFDLETNWYQLARIRGRILLLIYASDAALAAAWMISASTRVVGFGFGGSEIPLGELNKIEGGTGTESGFEVEELLSDLVCEPSFGVCCARTLEN